MEGKFKDFTELDAWKIAHEIRLKIFILTKFIPPREYALIDQIKRSSMSIAANIAEGHGRFHFQENIQFCRQARGSLEETRDHLTFIKDAKLIQKTSSILHLINLCEQEKIKINGYIGYLKKCKINTTNKPINN